MSEHRDLTERGKALRLLTGEAMSEMKRIEGKNGERWFAISPSQLRCFLLRAWTMAALAGQSAAWREASDQVRGR